MYICPVVVAETLVLLLIQYRSSRSCFGIILSIRQLFHPEDHRSIQVFFIMRYRRHQREKESNLLAKSFSLQFIATIAFIVGVCLYSYYELYVQRTQRLAMAMRALPGDIEILQGNEFIVSHFVSHLHSSKQRFVSPSVQFNSVCRPRLCVILLQHAFVQEEVSHCVVVVVVMVLEVGLARNISGFANSSQAEVKTTTVVGQNLEQKKNEFVIVGTNRGFN